MITASSPSNAGHQCRSNVILLHSDLKISQLYRTKRSNGANRRPCSLHFRLGISQTIYQSVSVATSGPRNLLDQREAWIRQKHTHEVHLQQSKNERSTTSVAEDACNSANCPKLLLPLPRQHDPEIIRRTSKKHNIAAVER